MKRLLSGSLLVAAAVATSAPANAADMPVVYKEAPVVWTWTGLYAGIALGYKLQKSDWSTTCLGLPGTFCNLGPTAANPFFVDASSPRSFDEGSFRVGGYFGYNWQVTQHWLIGLEADIAWADGKTTSAGIVGCNASGANCGFRTTPPASNTADSSSVRTTWDMSIRGRLGYLVQPDWLVYATGGLAGQHIEATLTCTAAGPWCVVTRNQTLGQLVGGYTVGGGVEVKVWERWLLRGEYRYSQFRKFEPSFFSGTVDAVFTSINLRTHIATAGIAYKF